MSKSKVLYGIEYYVEGTLCVLGPVFESLEKAEAECALLAEDPAFTYVRPYRLS